jgi:hypothetical protein
MRFLFCRVLQFFVRRNFLKCAKLDLSCNFVKLGWEALNVISFTISSDLIMTVNEEMIGLFLLAL